jgi:hypothetical protein
MTIKEKRSEFGREMRVAQLLLATLFAVTLVACQSSKTADSATSEAAANDNSSSVLPSCGDNICGTSEDTVTCPNDCGSLCGDNICGISEDTVTCPNDCGSLCGDGACNLAETPDSCPGDCTEVCGDGTCSSGENSQDCMEDCGSCETSCNLPNASASCDNGTCTLISCDNGYGNCDGLQDNGCETNLNTTINHCGGCSEGCNLPNATETCDGGVCTLTSCDNGYGNCDGLQDNGCETNLNTTMNHCGGCGKGCNLPNTTETCDGGVCLPADCNTGYADCDNIADNGCETSTETPVACPAECGSSSDYKLVNGQCLPSCGALINDQGWGDGTCCQNGCADASQAPNTTSDCPYCCPGGNSCVDSKPSCGDGTCEAPEDSSNCASDCGNAIGSSADVSLLSVAWAKYCAAGNDSKHSVLCNGDTAGIWEQYTFEKVDGSGPLQSGDMVALLSSGWGKYCAAEDVDGHVMHCNRDAVGSWEKYIITKVNGSGAINSGDTVSLLAVAWNTYCSALSSGAHPMHCNAASVGASEQFILNGEPAAGGPTCGDGSCNGNETKANCSTDCGSPPPVSSGCKTVLSDSLDGSTTGGKNGGSFTGGGWKAPHQIWWDLGQAISEGSFSVQVTNWNPNKDSSQHKHDKQHIINMYEESHGSSWSADGDSPKSAYFNIRTGKSYDNCYKFLSSTGGFEERLETRAKKPYGTISPEETHTLSVVWTANGTITSYLDGKAQVTHKHGKPFALRYVFIGTDNTIPGTYGPQHKVVYKNLVVNSGNTGSDASCGGSN